MWSEKLEEGKKYRMVLGTDAGVYAVILVDVVEMDNGIVTARDDNGVGYFVEKDIRMAAEYRPDLPESTWDISMKTPGEPN